MVPNINTKRHFRSRQVGQMEPFYPEKRLPRLFRGCQILFKMMDMD